MKTIKYLALLVGIGIFFSSCEKDNELVNPSYGFKLINNTDSLYAGELATFDFTGSTADNITIYTGDPGHNYSNYPQSKGAPITAPYSKYYYTYPQGGDFTITVVAINTGKEGEETKQVIKTLSVKVKDRRALAFTKFSVKSGSVSSPAGTFSKGKDSITVLVEPGTDLIKLLPVITKTADSAKIYYGPENKLWVKTDSLDFTTPILFTISSVEPSVSKSYLVIVKERKKKKETYLLTLKGDKQRVSIGKPDTAAQKVSIKIPWGISNIADTLNIKLTATTSANTKAVLGETVINGKNSFALELNKKDSISVTSEDGSKTSYYVFKVTQDSAFTSFTLNDSLNSLVASSQLVSIDNKAHTISIKIFGKPAVLNKGFIATFKGADIATVDIDGVVQKSGVTKNFFPTAGLVYKITSKETGQSTSYTVKIESVSK